MKVKYRGQIVDVPNQDDGNEFFSNWKCYQIDIHKSDFIRGTDKEYIKKNKYEAYCQNPMGSEIVCGYCDSTIKKCLQEVMDNIALDIDDLKNMLEDCDDKDRDELKYWINEIGE